MLSAIIALLAVAVSFLLLKDRFDRAIADIRLKAKREARARRSELNRAIAGINQLAENVRSTSDAAEAIAKRALIAAAEMSERFDRGEQPKDRRPMFSLQELQRPAEERAALQFAKLRQENEKRRREDEQRMQIRDTEVVPAAETKAA